MGAISDWKKSIRLGQRAARVPLSILADTKNILRRRNKISARNWRGKNWPRQGLLCSEFVESEQLLRSGIAGLDPRKSGSLATLGMASYFKRKRRRCDLSLLAWGLRCGRVSRKLRRGKRRDYGNGGSG